jgi:hypothetical protein
VLALPVVGARSAAAATNDLRLLNLCPHSSPGAGVLLGQVLECTWVRRSPTGLIKSHPDGSAALELEDAESRFRSLMSELGMVMAHRVAVPADSLGYAGFQISGEVSSTRISRDQEFWNGVDGVSPENPGARRPAEWLTTVGAFVRKGLWLPVPAVELGGGLVHLIDSHMMAWQGSAKIALHEGFHNWPLPSLAARGTVSYLTGTDQVSMTISSFDLLLSKGFGVLKTAHMDVFGGWSLLFISAHAQPMDLTPSCDAFQVRRAAAGEPLGDYCAEAQRGTGNDSLGTFAFADQDVVTRHRIFGGAKLKFATVFAAAQYEYSPPGRSRDETKPNGARDSSDAQQTVSLSAGFDF